MSPKADGQSALFALRKMGEKRPPIEEQLEAAGLPTFYTEFPFAAHLGRKWAFDYAWPELKIAFEIEGGGFGRYIVIMAGHERRRGQSIPIKPGTAIRFGGRHNTGEGLQADAEKYNRAAVLGWLVIRATSTMVRDGLAIADLVDAFTARGFTACRSPQGEPHVEARNVAAVPLVD